MILVDLRSKKDHLGEITMKEVKKDLRSQFTVSLIEKALLKTMKGKLIGKISVTELCNEAGVTRATFYNHYSDVEDVYKSMENKFFESISSSIQTMAMDNIDESFFVTILNLILEKKDLFNQIISSFSEDEFIHGMLDLIRDQARKQIRKKFPTLSSEQIDTYTAYVGYGIGGIIISWLNSGFSGNVEKVAKTIIAYQKSSMIVLENIDKEQG